MTDTLSKHQRNLAAFIHASTFSKYFIPFGNFLLPLLLWTANKKDHEFVDYNGKQALNFQISILLYGLVLTIGVSIFFLVFAFDFIGFTNVLEVNEHNLREFNRNYSGFGIHIVVAVLAGFMGIALLVLDVVCSIIAALKGSNGEKYKYPFTINFIK